MLKTELVGRNVLKLRLPLKRNASWEHWHLLLSDVHFDSTHCDRELLKTHLDLAKSRAATISCHGDLVDVMQGNQDKRQWKRELRPEYVGLLEHSYYEAVVDDVCKFLQPYRDHIVSLGDGNHETKIDRYGEHRALTKQVIFELNRGIKRPIQYGHYSGYLVFLFEDKGSKNTHTCQYNLHYHHGSGLKSKAARHRRAMTYPDADCIALGHHHNFDFEWIPRMRITWRGLENASPMLILECPGYKTCGDMADGWAVEKGMMPTPAGAWMLRFRFYRTRRDGNEVERVEVEPHMLK